MDKKTKRDLKIVGVLAVGVWLLTRNRDAHAATGAGGGGGTTPPIYTPVTPNQPATPAGANTPILPLIPPNIDLTPIVNPPLVSLPTDDQGNLPPPSTALDYVPPIIGPPHPDSAAGGAQILFHHINATQKKYGSVKAARRNMNTATVKTAQKNLGVKADGKPGPRTYVKAALNHAKKLPLVAYWRSGATAADVAEYKKAINQVAAIHEKHGQDGSLLRTAVARETGQGRGA